MQVATYEVVPLSPWLGMLEFVGGTRPLMDVLQGELDPEPARVAFVDFIQVRPPCPPAPRPLFLVSHCVLLNDKTRCNIFHFTVATLPHCTTSILKWERNSQRRRLAAEFRATAAEFRASQQKSGVKIRF